MRQLEFLSSSPEQTAKFAQSMSGLLKPGDVVFLIGQLGAGKTFFIRNAARGLGVAEPVTSPSFTMAQTYDGRVRIHHLDLYRLADFSGDDTADFETFFEADAITFIEWPEQAAAFIEEPDVTVYLEHHDINSRRITIECRHKEMFPEMERLIDAARD